MQQACVSTRSRSRLSGYGAACTRGPGKVAGGRALHTPPRERSRNGTGSLKEYHRPANMAEALALLRRSSARTVPLGGGAYLTTHSDPRIEAVVDLSSLGLDTVEEAGEEMRIGAMVRFDSVAAGALPGRAGRILAQVARLQASWQLRRGTTLGGALVTGSTVELAAILWVLNARVLLRGESARTIPFAAFLDERDSLPPGTLLTGLIVPGLAADEGAGTARVSRTPADGPSVSAAAYVRRQARCKRGRQPGCNRSGRTPPPPTRGGAGLGDADLVRHAGGTRDRIDRRLRFATHRHPGQPRLPAGDAWRLRQAGAGSGLARCDWLTGSERGRARLTPSRMAGYCRACVYTGEVARWDCTSRRNLSP